MLIKYRQLVHSPESTEGIENGVQKLGNQSGAVVSEPKKFFGISAKPGGHVPPSVVGPDVKALADGIYDKACKHQPWCIGENSFDAGLCPVIGIGLIEHPGLGNQDKKKRSQNSQIYGFLCGLFSGQFTQNIGYQKSGGE